MSERSHFDWYSIVTGICLAVVAGGGGLLVVVAVTSIYSMH